MLPIGLKILKTIIRMNKIEQLTFPWSKSNNSSFGDFYIEENNNFDEGTIDILIKLQKIEKRVD